MLLTNLPNFHFRNFAKNIQFSMAAKKCTLIFFLLISFLSNFAQDSSGLRISLVTCTPGNELYSIFGHSAIRVIDSANNTDRVYNYGTFNFDDPNFYIKFMRGKLLYFVIAQQTESFIEDYQYMQRGLTEQELQLRAAEKRYIRDSLLLNILEENKYYKYDFFYDNCTTRLRDLIMSALNRKNPLPAVMSEKTTFRQAIHQYLDNGHQYWSKLGIDLILGLPTDKIMTATEQGFLPNNLMVSLEKEKSKKLIASTTPLYMAPVRPSEVSIWQPGFVIGLFSLLLFLMTFIKKAPLLSIIADRTWLFITGFLGIILLVMWTLTDHSMTVKNFNLLWAFPLNMVVVFIPNMNRSLLKNYFKFQTIVTATLLGAWFFIPQQLNTALIPFVMLITYRSFILSKKQ